VEGLAVDAVNGRVFFAWNNQSGRAIRVSNLDGSGMAVFKALPDTSVPFDVEIDPVKGFLYWNNDSAIPGEMSRSLLDGSGQVERAFTIANSFRNGFHFDSIGGKVYYADEQNNPTNSSATCLWRSNPDGSSPEFLRDEPDGVNYVEVVRPRPALGINTYAGLSIFGQTGATYEIQYTCDLLRPTNWVTLTTLTLPNSPYLYFDPTSAGHPGRFYRALVVP